MGAYLDKPVTEKESESGHGNGLTYGATCMQGWRVKQEVSCFFFALIFHGNTFGGGIVQAMVSYSNMYTFGNYALKSTAKVLSSDRIS